MRALAPHIADGLTRDYPHHPVIIGRRVIESGVWMRAWLALGMIAGPVLGILYLILVCHS